MMKKIVLLGSMAVAGLLPVAASATDKTGPYVAFSGHAAFTEDSDTTLSGLPINTSFDTGFGIGAALGYDLAGSGLRLEGEMVYRYNEAEVSSPPFPFTASADVDSIAYMANAYYDINTNSSITPYVGAGAGMVDVDGEDTVFAYQGMLGAAFNINANNELYAGYRYFAAEDADLGGGASLEYVSHSAELGYRIRF